MYWAADWMQLKIVNWKIGLKKLKQKNKEMEILWDIVFVWEPRGQTLKEWFAFRRCISESSQKDIIKVKHGWAEGEFELWCNSKRGLSQSCRSSGNGSAFQRCPNLRQDLGCLPSCWAVIECSCLWGGGIHLSKASLFGWWPCQTRTLLWVVSNQHS